MFKNLFDSAVTLLTAAHTKLSGRAGAIVKSVGQLIDLMDFKSGQKNCAKTKDAGGSYFEHILLRTTSVAYGRCPLGKHRQCQRRLQGAGPALTVFFNKNLIFPEPEWRASGTFSSTRRPSGHI